VTLFVRNISESVQESDIQGMMDEAGVKILGVRLIIGDQGEKRGIAFIDVENNEIAEAALALNNHDLQG
jgi:RNA recognition motif-containing protein